MGLDPFVGEIMIFAGNFAPVGYAMCAGQLLSIEQNTALFSILGTTYGGNGTTNFALPDLRGRVPISFGSGPGLTPFVLGEVDGSETATLNTNQIPSHTHVATSSVTVTENVSNSVGTLGAPNGGFLAKDPTGGEVPLYNPAATSGKTLNAGSHIAAATVTVNPAGGGQPFGLRNPLLVLNFCIALQGIFPSRN
jgi:microcystin-dependent protein